MPIEPAACANIIGFISSIVTIEEAGRTWIREVREKFTTEEFDFDTYTSENELVNRNLDCLKQYLTDSGRKEIISEKEMNEIKAQINNTICLDYYSREELSEIIDKLFAGINKYINEHLTIGEKIIINHQMEMLDGIHRVESELKKSEEYKKVQISRFITDIAPNPPGKFAYRETEIAEIIKLQKEKNNIAVCGVGGIGKTAILRRLYQDYMKDEQYYLGWIPYSGDFTKDVLENSILFQNITDYDDREKALKEFFREKNRSVVLFIDNVTEDICKDAFFQFLCRAVKVFISARYWNEDDLFYKYELNFIDPENAINLFWDYYGKKIEDTEVQERIEMLIQGINYHTLMIEMVAKAAQFAEESLLEFLDKVNNIGYRYPEDEIQTGHDKKEETIAVHLANLYQLENSSEDGKYILYNFAIMKDYTLPSDFRIWISDEENVNESKKNFNWLIKRGWINKENGGYSMHPIIKQSILMQGKIEVNHIFALIQQIQNNEFFDETLEFTKINQRINIAKSILEYFAPYEDKDALVFEIMEGFVLACGSQSRFEEGIYFANAQFEWSVSKYGGIYNDFTAEALFNLARILCEARQFDEARRCCDLLYGICKRLYDENDMRLFYFREVYIQVCIEQKDYDLATAEYLYASDMVNPDITEKKKIKNDMAYCSMLINKYANAQKSGYVPFASAEKLYLDEAEKILLNIFPTMMDEYCDKPLELLIWYQNMANICAYRDDVYSALEYDRKIVEVREEKLGEMNGKLAEAYFNLADDLYKIAYREKKTAKEALFYINKAREIINCVYSNTSLKHAAENLFEIINQYETDKT